jgi:hypothetical protein
MNKNFNITGTCIPHKHYLADNPEKIKQILEIVEAGEYFTIASPGQYGKTTTIHQLDQALKEREDYLVLKISFEAIDASAYSNQELFTAAFLAMLKESLSAQGKNELAGFMDGEIPAAKNMSDLSLSITGLVRKAAAHTVLLIDEVDKASDNPLFLDFLEMLRTKYLKRGEGEENTFHSVILAGVHDVKTLKSGIPSAGEKNKRNNPWDIAVDFKIDLSLFPGEIAAMLADYAGAEGVAVDIPRFSEQLFYYTSGYPFLVGKLCKILAEEILPQKQEKEWTEKDLLKAVQIMLKEESANFAALIENLKNNEDLFELVHDVTVKGLKRSFSRNNPAIGMGAAYGIFKEENGRIKIHNRIYEQIIYNYMSSKTETPEMSGYNSSDNFIEADGSLNIEKILLKFQLFIREQYRRKDSNFLERNCRLLFLAFLKPIIDAHGFDFKEAEISEEKRLDIVVIYLDRKYIIELKRWQGEKAHKKGLRQLADYIDRQEQEEGFLLIFDFRKGRDKGAVKGDGQRKTTGGKEIFMIRV